jgi:hypothetical protein
MKLYGPFTVEMEVFITNGSQFGKVTYELPKSDSDISIAGFRQYADKAVEQVREQLKDDSWRLCTKRETFDQITEGVCGQSGFAMPGSETEWDEKT